MANLFSKPNIPKPQPAPPAPTVDDARLKVEEQQRMRTRRGRAATLMVGQEGGVSTAAKTLTGN